MERMEERMEDGGWRMEDGGRNKWIKRGGMRRGRKVVEGGKS